jgi:hypothetical protein
VRRKLLHVLQGEIKVVKLVRANITRYMIIGGMGLGLTLLALPEFLLLRALLHYPLVFALVAFSLCAVTLAVGASSLCKRLRAWRQHRHIKQAEYSELAEWLAPRLQENHPLNIITAAQKLGAARDVTAVPDLMDALERCVETQPPGWSECAAALANALARIGDRRALPLLYRLDNVRGIGLIPAVRNAIAAIEPQTSLLRAGSAFDVSPDSLLRSVQARPDANESAILLRSGERGE